MTQANSGSAGAGALAPQPAHHQFSSPTVDRSRSALFAGEGARAPSVNGPLEIKNDLLGESPQSHSYHQSTSSCRRISSET